MKKFIKGNCMKRAVSLVLIVALSLSVAESIGSTKVVYAEESNLATSQLENTDTYAENVELAGKYRISGLREKKG